jgi:uncharacterized protein YxjI
MLSIGDDFWIENERGEKVYKVDGKALRVRSTLIFEILAHEYKFEQGGRRVAEVSQKWFRVRDSYGVEIEPGQDDILILAATVVVDMIANPGR